MGIFGDRIMRCAEGHFFTMRQSSRLFNSVHLGPLRLMQCPVDGHVVMVGNVREDTLTPQQLEEARRYRV